MISMQSLHAISVTLILLCEFIYAWLFRRLRWPPTQVHKINCKFDLLKIEIETENKGKFIRIVKLRLFGIFTIVCIKMDSFSNELMWHWLPKMVLTIICFIGGSHDKTHRYWVWCHHIVISGPFIFRLATAVAGATSAAKISRTAIFKLFTTRWCRTRISHIVYKCLWLPGCVACNSIYSKHHMYILSCLYSFDWKYSGSVCTWNTLHTDSEFLDELDSHQTTHWPR